LINLYHQRGTLIFYITLPTTLDKWNCKLFRNFKKIQHDCFDQKWSKNKNIKEKINKKANIVSHLFPPQWWKVASFCPRGGNFKQCLKKKKIFHDLVYWKNMIYKQIKIFKRRRHVFCGWTNKKNVFTIIVCTLKQTHIKFKQNIKQTPTNNPLPKK